MRHDFIIWTAFDVMVMIGFRNIFPITDLIVFFCWVTSKFHFPRLQRSLTCLWDLIYLTYSIKVEITGQVFENDIFYRLMNNTTNVQGAITSEFGRQFSQLTWSFDAPNCCLDTVAPTTRYATLNIGKHYFAAKYIWMARFTYIRGPDMRWSTVSFK